MSVAEDVGTCQAHKEPGAVKNLVAGGVGGVCLVVTGHPLDTIKVGVANDEHLPL